MVSAFELLAPSLLAALVVTQAVGGQERIVLDERLVGLAAAAVAIRFQAPLIVVMAGSRRPSRLWPARSGHSRA